MSIDIPNTTTCTNGCFILVFRFQRTVINWPPMHNTYKLTQLLISVYMVRESVESG